MRMMSTSRAAVAMVAIAGAAAVTSHAQGARQGQASGAAGAQGEPRAVALAAHAVERSALFRLLATLALDAVTELALLLVEFLAAALGARERARDRDTEHGHP